MFFMDCQFAVIRATIIIIYIYIYIMENRFKIYAEKLRGNGEGNIVILLIIKLSLTII